LVYLKPSLSRWQGRRLIARPSLFVGRQRVAENRLRAIGAGVRTKKGAR
jgi:hypothetical protein